MTISNQSAPAQQVSLSLNDLRSCANVIEVCTQRGAFKAEELLAVGQLYSKITAFLSQAVPAQADTSAAEETASDTSTEGTAQC